MPHSDPGLLHALRALSILLEERNVTRAALRIHLSQSSTSRTLQRLRVQFGDELLVRAEGEYELTPRARELQRELALLLPRLENLVSGRGFDPTTATGIVRLIGTDYTTATLGPYLLPALVQAAPDLEVRIEPRDQDSYADLHRGRAEVALSVMRPPAPLRWERLFTDDTVCVVDRDHPIGERFTVDEYVAARHVVIMLVDDDQPMIERWLQSLGHRRTAAVRVAYFSSAFAALPGTRLVATVLRRFAESQAAVDPRVRLVEAPEDFDAVSYGMVWHPRLDDDPRHRWLRETIRRSAQAMLAEHP